MAMQVQVVAEDTLVYKALEEHTRGRTVRVLIYSTASFSSICF